MLLTSSTLFYHPERNMWITTEYLSSKSLRFLFHRELSRETRVLESFSLK
jgi:hypothetical protein